jgi:hypothetical protein
LLIIPFIIGLVVDYLFHEMLEVAIIAAIILIVVAYFGFFGLSIGALKGIADTYGPVAIQYRVLLMGILPLDLGLIVGFVLGFVLS